MTSFANMAQAIAASLPSTSTAGPSANSSHNSNEQEEGIGMTHLISKILQNMNEYSYSPDLPTTSSASTSTGPTVVPYDMWAYSASSSQHNLLGPLSRENNLMFSNNNQRYSKEDNSRDSPATSSSVSLTCCRCEERMPTMRCNECNDIYCHECCHNVTSECQIREHTLLPINQVSPIGVRPNSVNNEKEACCEAHGEVARFYCEPCATFACTDCTRWIHKDHSLSPIKGTLDMCRIGIYKAIEDTKAGTKAIKAAIDRAVALSKSYEKETAEANMKIRKSMRCFIQAIEDREKLLLEKVERMRQAKLNEISDHMNTLRGILAGLAHTNETMVRSMDSEGVDLVSARKHGRAQVDYYSCMFKRMYIAEEKISVIPPNYELLDQLKKQCDVQLTISSSLQSYAAAAPLIQTIQPTSLNLPVQIQSLQTISHHLPTNNSLRSLPGFFANHSRSSYYDQTITSPLDCSPPGLGQSIHASWNPVIMKPSRCLTNAVPIFAFGTEGQEQGQVSRPWGLCVDRDGNIIVADRRNNRIQIFNSRGEFKTMFGCKGTGPGEFDLPAGITTDIYGRIVVIDKDNHRVQIFTSNGSFILKFGSYGKEPGQFQYPWDVSTNTQGNIVVTDTRNHRIQLFNNEGHYITKFVFESVNPAKMIKGPTTPRGVCFTTTGNIVVSDFENHRLLMVDPSLTKLLHCIGREGAGFGEVSRPSGMVTDDDGNLAVADSKNHRVLIFNSDLHIISVVDLKNPNHDDKDRPSDVAFTLNGNLVVLFETLPDTARDPNSQTKQYIKVY